MLIAREYTARGGMASARSKSPGSQGGAIQVHHGARLEDGHFQDK